MRPQVALHSQLPRFLVMTVIHCNDNDDDDGDDAVSDIQPADG